MATRYSQGGQNNGVWTREIKDSKIYWVGTSIGTETGYWGERISLPVNAPGDIFIEAQLRQRIPGAGNGRFSIGVNEDSASFQAKYGCVLAMGAGATAIWGTNNVIATLLPGFPGLAPSFIYPADFIAVCKIRRKNGYMFLYINEKYVGQYAYAPTITSVDIMAYFQNTPAVPKWVDWLRVTPSSVVNP